MVILICRKNTDRLGLIPGPCKIQGPLVLAAILVVAALIFINAVYVAAEFAAVSPLRRDPDGAVDVGVPPCHHMAERDGTRLTPPGRSASESASSHSFAGRNRAFDRGKPRRRIARA